MFERIETGIAPSSAPVNDAVRAGEQVWLVAVAEDPATGEIVSGDIEVQTERAIGNLEIAMRAAGGALADIVQVQVFLIDKADAAGMNRAYARHFQPPYPVRATVVVKDLLAEGLRVEMLATAVLS
ncbi:MULTISPECIES: Rid family hydrolase [unclassified Devosia]|uniref:RidA family protein n=1 Tax=unclassified Devosia TaxID=196773 RepID=UPI001552DCAE|nr:MULTISPECIES: Rid family hydrolase [unclassified Devosia]